MRTPPRPSRTPQKVLAPAQPSPSRASYIEAGAEAEVPDREALTPKPRVSDGAGARDGTPMEPRLQALHAATRHHLAERHERFGYDPLDRMVIEARRRKENGLRSNKQPAGDLSPAGHEAPEDFEGGDSEFETEYASDLRRLLRDHVELMEAEGVVFRHAFREKRLGFKICIARYGTDGRCFVTVEETLPHCPLYAGALMPTDEVIAINGTLILEPCAEMFDALRESIEKAERPVDFTFIQGERREEAFAEQEERRGMTGEEPIDLAIYATLVADTRARAASAAESARFAAAALEAFVAGRGEAAEDPLLAAQRAEAYSAQCSRAALRVAAIRVDSRSAKCENDHERASKIIADAGAGAVASAEAALASAQTYHEARRIGRAGALAARAADDDRARKLGQAGALEARAAAAAGAGAANAAEARAAADEAKTAVAELRALEEEWGRGPASGAEAAHFALQVASLCRSATNAAGRAEATAALKERQVEVSRALATAAIAEKAEAAAALKEQEAEASRALEAAAIAERAEAAAALKEREAEVSRALAAAAIEAKVEAAKVEAAKVEAAIARVEAARVEAIKVEVAKVEAARVAAADAESAAALAVARLAAERAEVLRAGAGSDGPSPPAPGGDFDDARPRFYALPSRSASAVRAKPSTPRATPPRGAPSSPPPPTPHDSSPRFQRARGVSAARASAAACVEVERDSIVVEREIADDDDDDVGGTDVFCGLSCSVCQSYMAQPPENAENEE